MLRMREAERKGMLRERRGGEVRIWQPKQQLMPFVASQAMAANPES
jgi:hypothetical protein